MLPIDMASAAHKVNLYEPAAGNEVSYSSNSETSYYSGGDVFYEKSTNHTSRLQRPIFVNYQVE